MYSPSVIPQSAMYWFLRQTILRLLCVCARGQKKALRLRCFSARGQKKRCVYCAFALGDKKSIAFTLFLRSGAKKALRLLCFLLSERAVLPNGPSAGVRALRTNSLATSKNPMRTAVWGTN